jgi:hypothetical protein
MKLHTLQEIIDGVKGEVRYVIYRGGSNCLQKPDNIHRNRLKTLAFYY